MEKHTAKHFFLQLGSLICLYLTLGFFVALVFGFINLGFPDSIDNVWQIEQAASAIRLGFAMVLVFFPTYLVLTRLVNKNRRHAKDHGYLGLTKWLIYLSLLVSGLVLLGDLVAVIMNFLEGGMTLPFILKAATVFIVIGAAFTYYIQDAKGYWMRNERKSIIYGVVTVLIIVTTLIASLTQIPNPNEVREKKVDTQMMRELQDMQWRIEDYYRSNQVLPEDLPTLYGEFEVPTPPEEKPAYEYEKTSDTTYNLCATFTYDSNEIGGSRRLQDSVVQAPNARGNYNWDYKSGHWCFDRVIEPSISNKTAQPLQ
jgi:hypothetical protein